ncbi:MAG: GDP-L-fucose synthase [Bacteroidales bacterium]|nr:GDP-L-fucose synthase [Bacteroidales bacterium]MCF8350611.1 GDP-L-fucose synthase [Bacteroidales bacterium]MCF8377156.1 GDP-L-fucose synthase [Bacteroidales bacterium]
MDAFSKIFVAGHNGLVGSAIVKKLRKKGYENLLLVPRAKLDLTNQRAVADFFEAENPEYVFLAAALVGGIYANDNYRANFIFSNLTIQNNVIHQCWKSGVKKLLFLGSTCIYPKEAPQPMKEEYLLTSPLEYTNEPYAIAKIAGLKMCESYNIQYGTNFITVMPTNLYGPSDNYDLENSHVLPAILRKVLIARALETNDWSWVRKDLELRPMKNFSAGDSYRKILNELEKFGIRKNKADKWEVEIWGSGRPMREFLWSEELADACVFCMENVDFKDVIPGPGEEIRNTHLNIGTGEQISIRELAELVKGKTGFTGNLFFNTSKPDGTLKKLTDPSRIHQLGWYHNIEIDQGVDILIEWYQKSIKT